MGKKYRILISAVPAMGHINSVVGFGDLLKARGHHVIFAQIERFRKLAEDHDFEFRPFDEKIIGQDDGSKFMEWIADNSKYFGSNWIEEAKNMTEKDSKIFASIFKGSRAIDRAFDKVMNEIGHIDCTVTDFSIILPCQSRRKNLINIPLISFNPLPLYPSGPGIFSGFSIKNSDQSAWAEYKTHMDRLWADTKRDRIEWFKSEGLVDLAENMFKDGYIPPPDYFGFYLYPEDLDYTEFGKPHRGWIRVDSCIRDADSTEKFEIPESLRYKPGKLIYFSLGSLASCDLKVMRKILSILAISPHRFIVSTGHHGDQLELADNMWGQPYVDQLKVLQTVDMAIIHGGNNSIVETLYYARPMIVIPYFFDQLDNAGRIEDLGLGRRFDIWNIDGREFLETIEKTLINTEVHEKIRAISLNMRSSTSQVRAAKMIEDLIDEKMASANQS